MDGEGKRKTLINYWEKKKKRGKKGQIPSSRRKKKDILYYFLAEEKGLGQGGWERGREGFIQSLARRKKKKGKLSLPRGGGEKHDGKGEGEKKRKRSQDRHAGPIRAGKKKRKRERKGRLQLPFYLLTEGGEKTVSNGRMKEEGGKGGRRLESLASVRGGRGKRKEKTRHGSPFPPCQTDRGSSMQRKGGRKKERR